MRGREREKGRDDLVHELKKIGVEVVANVKNRERESNKKGGVLKKKKKCSDKSWGA